MNNNPFKGLYSSQGKWRQPPETPMEVAKCLSMCFAHPLDGAIELIKTGEGKDIVLLGRKEQWSAYDIAEALYALTERTKNRKN